jgi:hypothetical protein
MLMVFRNQGACYRVFLVLARGFVLISLDIQYSAVIDSPPHDGSSPLHKQQQNSVVC